MALHFLLSTALLSSVFLDHLSHLNYQIWSEGVLENFEAVSYGSREYSENIFRTDSITIMCSSSSTSFDSNEAIHIFKDYYQSKGSMEWAIYQPNITCILFDSPRKLLWLIADNSGTFPLWFAFRNVGEEKNLIVTTDLLAAIAHNYTSITAVGAGLALGFDSSRLEILCMNHWSSIQSDGFPNEPRPEKAEEWSQSVMSATKSALTPYLSGTFMTEFDPLDASSMLLECALATHPKMNQQFRARYHTQPLVRDIEQDFSIIDQYTYGLIERFEESKRPTLPHSDSYLRLAQERAKICKLASDTHTLGQSYSLGHVPTDPVFLSFDSSFSDYRPEKVFFQNHFCSLLNVTILYPFQGALLWNSLEKTRYPISLLNKVVRFFLEINQCGERFPENKSRSLVIDEEEKRNIFTFSSNNQTFVVHKDSQLDFLFDEESPSRNPDNITEIFSFLSNTPQFNSFPERLVIRISEVIRTTETNELILLLVTASYEEIFMNFICHLDRLYEHENLKSKMFFVLTPHASVEDIARSANFNVLRVVYEDLEPLFPFIHPDHLHQMFRTNGSDYGYLLYQQLIYLRTLTASYLLEQGYAVIIADIDTVWLHNPLQVLSSDERKNLDLQVTKDGADQICGCYIYLSSTPAARAFWKEITNRHFQLIKKYYVEDPTVMDNMFDSEQIILSNMLLFGQNPIPVRVWLLNSEQFPTGYDYFVAGTVSTVPSPTHLSPSPIVIIHNNFIIGGDMKKIRFQRHNLWRVAFHPLTQKIMCVNDREDISEWNEVRSFSVSEGVILPTLSVILPIHHEVLPSHRIRVLLTVERNTKLPPSEKFESGAFWVSRIPENTGFFFNNNFLIAEAFATPNTSKFHYSVSLENSNIFMIGDIGVNGLEYTPSYQFKNFMKLSLPKLQSPQIELPTSGESFPLDAFPGECIEDRLGLVVTSPRLFVIKVLTYNRPQSLLRLLQSLLLADYGLNNSVGLYIHIDHPDENAPLSKVSLREEVLGIAEQFHWPFGIKRLVYHEVHAGLKGQWNTVNFPHYDEVAKENIISIVLEDDVTVSPYFFLWTLRATDAYYTSKQIKLQEDLREAVAQDITENPISTTRPDDLTSHHVNKFLETHSDFPLIIGISLAKQDLDPVHSPINLEIRNNFSPFLFSLVGTWGTVIFPVIWETFITWWNHRENIRGYSPLLNKDIITDKFFMKNPTIWSPWMIRFAHECGGKWLYPNLPGRLSLVTNHREKGENYRVSMGASTILLHPEHLLNQEAGLIDTTFGTTCLWYFPSLDRLSRWQYDIELSRIGRDYLYGDMPLLDTHSFTSLKKNHWIEILSIIEGYLPSKSNILHIGDSPFVIPLRNLYRGVHLVVSNTCAHFLPDTQLDCILFSQLTLPRMFSYKIHLLVIDLTLFGRYSFHFTGHALPSLKRIWNWLEMSQYPFQYILVLTNDCIVGPTDLMINKEESFGNKLTITNRMETNQSSYGLLEDVCSESTGYGALLYRTMLRSPNMKENRFAVSRRIAGKLISRRIIERSGS